MNSETTQIEPRHATVEVGGLKIHYVDYGAPSEGAMDLLLLHGISSSWGSWRRVAEHLASTYRVIAYDARGHGDSQWAAAYGYTTKHFVAELEEFVDRVGLNRFILVGQSMGGHHAIAYIGRHPERIITSIINDIYPARSFQLGRDPNFQRPVITDLDAWVEKRVESQPLTPRWAHELAARELMRPVEGGWAPKHDPNVSPWVPDDHWPEMRAITCPILFIRGGRGVVKPETLQEMVMAVPSARSVTLEKAGHTTFWDMEPEWIAAVDEFLHVHARP